MAGGVITTGSHPILEWPGIRAIWGQVYDMWTNQWEQLVDAGTSDKSYEEEVQVVDFGLAPVKPQGAPIEYDSEIQGPVSRWTNITYALGYQVTMEELQDNLYSQVSADRATSLAMSMQKTKEYIVANIYNNGFTNTAPYLGADGVSFFNSAHPNTTGGTFSNVLSASADLSEAAIEDLTIQIQGTLDDRGLPIAVMPEKIIVPRQYYYQLTRIMKSQFQTGTANNDVNAVAATGQFPKGGYVNQYLSSQTAWFITTNIPRGRAKLLQRMVCEFAQDNDFGTKNALASAVERYSVFWADPRYAFASAG